MGRLLKKKPTDQKKKKKQRLGDANSIKSEGVADGSGSVAVQAAQDVRKKKVSVAKKTGGGAAKPVPVKREKNFLDKSIQFLREVRIELKKVTWPSKKQTMGSTLVVIILVSLIAIFLGVIDVGLSGLVRLVLQQ
jgi:preprotein translocase subunit SecE